MTSRRLTIAIAALGGAGVAIAGFVGAGFSAYLTYLELAVIDAICQWCVASAIVMTAIAAVSAIRYVAGDERTAHYLPEVRQTPDAAPGAERHPRGMQARTHAR
jgi:hypothetical protein